MLPNRGFLVLALHSAFIVHVLALKNVMDHIDDILGAKYVAKEDVDEAKRVILSNGNGYGTDWIVMPDGNGTSQIAILHSGKNGQMSKFFGGEEKFLFELKPVEENVHFKLYTKENPREGESMRPGGPNSKFDSSKRTKIVIHGWRSSSDSETFTSIRDAYLSRSDVNVIAVDWSEPASNIFYPTPAAYTKEVGKYVAELIDDLTESKGARYEDFHIIGHSLGAHCAGIAGHFTREKVSRVTGLDPALPGFVDADKPENKLDESDAQFVEIIHTCAGILGMSSPIGHADFYPNGGSPLQPGCCCVKELIQTCSHGRSHKYFAESILSEEAFEGKKCQTWSMFKNNSCEDTVIPMGEFTPVSARGTFYLRTNSQFPFGLGDAGTEFNSG